MKSSSNKDLVIITSRNDKYFNELENKLHFSKDSRVKFVGTVYDQELLKNIRENAYAYIHGHTVGGTNPSLIEALGSTKLNLLIDVGFNKEVGEDGALYWNKDDDNLKRLIDDVDNMDEENISKLGKRAKDRVLNEYTWDKICKKYEDVFINGITNK
jgi:rhamnosyltransferase